MSTYVLIHGSWHGAWCWYKLIPRLRAAGHRVIAPDLASLGRDRTPSTSVTLARWADDICTLLDAETDPVILVGHSRGGIVISEVAERRPQKVKSLVYLTAFLLSSGTSLLDATSGETESLVVSNLEVSESTGTMQVRESAVRDAFYGECSEEDVALAISLLLPEAVAPSATPVTVTDGRFGSVPRIYIECLRDRALVLPMQRRMQARLPCSRVFALDTDHSPFFSMPDELAQLLVRV